jgi:Holliday junction resolvase
VLSIIKKMVNTRKKGRRYERMCNKKLISKGWFTYLVPPQQRFQKNVDIFGMFDIIAIKKTDLCKTISYYNNMKLKEVPMFQTINRLYVQVKHEDKWTKETIRKLTEFKKKFLGDSDIVQLWNWRKNKGWEITNIPVEVIE